MLAIYNRFSLLHSTHSNSTYKYILVCLYCISPAPDVYNVIYIVYIYIFSAHQKAFCRRLCPPARSLQLYLRVLFVFFFSLSPPLPFFPLRFACPINKQQFASCLYSTNSTWCPPMRESIYVCSLSLYSYNTIPLLLCCAGGSYIAAVWCCIYY